MDIKTTTKNFPTGQITTTLKFDDRFPIDCPHCENLIRKSVEIEITPIHNTKSFPHHSTIYDTSCFYCANEIIPQMQNYAAALLAALDQNFIS